MDEVHSTLNGRDVILSGGQSLICIEADLDHSGLSLGYEMIQVVLADVALKMATVELEHAGFGAVQAEQVHV